MFSISVKIDSIESRKRSAGLLHIVIGFFLIAKGTDYFRLMKYNNFISVLPVFTYCFLFIILWFFQKEDRPTASFNFTMRLLQFITFMILGIVMVHYGTYIDYTALFIFAFLCFVLLFSERKVFHDTYIVLDNNGIKIPGYYKDHQIPWNALNKRCSKGRFCNYISYKTKISAIPGNADFISTGTGKNECLL